MKTEASLRCYCICHAPREQNTYHLYLQFTDYGFSPPVTSRFEFEKDFYCLVDVEMYANKIIKNFSLIGIALVHDAIYSPENYMIKEKECQVD